MATESFVHAVNQLTNAHCDQDYLNYVVLNDAQIPDRTAYILDHHRASPLPALKSDVRLLNRLAVQFIVMTCNTAHYFVPELTKISRVPILNMPMVAVKAASQQHSDLPLRIGILATTGTIQSHLYQDIIHANGHVSVVPSEAEQVQLMDLIYHDIKQHSFVDQAKFHGLIAQLLNVEHCDAVILGCTELSVAQATNPFMSEKVIDAQQELAKAAVYRAQSVKTTLLWEQRKQSVNRWVGCVRLSNKNKQHTYCVSRSRYAVLRAYLDCVKWSDWFSMLRITIYMWRIVFKTIGVR